MNLDSLGPAFETAVHAGLGIRIFQAFARSLPSPGPTSGGLYIFWFSFIQALSDNKDRELPITSPVDTNHGNHI